MPTNADAAMALNRLILSYWNSPTTEPLQILFPCAQSDDKAMTVVCGDVVAMGSSYDAYVQMLSNFQQVPSEQYAILPEDYSRMLVLWRRFAQQSEQYLDEHGDPHEFRVQKGGNGLMQLTVDKAGFCLSLYDCSVRTGLVEVRGQRVPDVLALAETELHPVQPHHALAS